MKYYLGHSFSGLEVTWTGFLGGMRVLCREQTWRWEQKVAPVRAQKYCRPEDIPEKEWGGQHGKRGKK